MRMPAAAEQRSKLSVNQQRVHDTLTAAIQPLTAYEVIDRISTDGTWAPPTVYRALKRLIEQGLVHRLESRNAFVACTCQHKMNESVIFIVCEKCDATKELLDVEISTRLKQLADEHSFLVARRTLELRGLCERCMRL